MSEKQLQEKLLTYRVLESRLDGLVKQRDFLVNKIMEFQSTLNGIEELDKSEGDILFPIGGDAYKAGKLVSKDRMIVSIGANIALEKSTEEGKALIAKRKDEVENSINHLQQEIMNITQTMAQLEPEIQNLSKEMQNTSQAG